MGEYASGLSLGQMGMLDKERIKHAFKGELMCGENEDGFVYEKADRAVCERYILDAFDNMYYFAKQGNDASRVLERMLEKNGIEIGMREFMEEMEKAKREFDDYVYEGANG